MDSFARASGFNRSLASVLRNVPIKAKKRTTRLGLEPRMREPKSLVLPLHHRVKVFAEREHTLRLWRRVHNRE